MANKFSRRLLLKSFLVGGSAFLGGIYFFRIFRWRNPEQLVVDLAYKNLRKLEVPREELHRFAHDFLKTYGEKYQRYMTASRYQIFPFGREGRLVREFSNFIADTFLRSSTFWDQPLSDSPPIQYKVLYNPFDKPCENILANFSI